MGDLLLKLPSKELCKAYEEKRKQVLESRYAEYLKQAKTKREEREKKYRDPLQEALAIKDKLISKKGRISAYKIASELGIGLTQAYQIKHKLETREETSLVSNKC